MCGCEVVVTGASRLRLLHPEIEYPSQLILPLDSIKATLLNKI
jgi:hypothetical protein